MRPVGLTQLEVQKERHSADNHRKRVQVNRQNDASIGDESVGHTRRYVDNADDTDEERGALLGHAVLLGDLGDVQEGREVAEEDEEVRERDEQEAQIVTQQAKVAHLLEYAHGDAQARVAFVELRCDLVEAVHAAVVRLERHSRWTLVMVVVLVLASMFRFLFACRVQVLQLTLIRD